MGRELKSEAARAAVVDKLKSEAALAAYLDVQQATLRQWRWQGRGPRWIKVGGRVRYDDDDVRAWLETQKAGVDKEAS